jgi:hypothetical protein
LEYENQTNGQIICFPKLPSDSSKFILTPLRIPVNKKIRAFLQIDWVLSVNFPSAPRLAARLGGFGRAQNAIGTLCFSFLLPLSFQKTIKSQRLGGLARCRCKVLISLDPKVAKS